MAELKIISAPDDRLREISKPVENVDKTLQKLMDDMLESMYGAFGLGLAAIQVGVPKRIVVMDISDEKEPPAPQYFINPEITWTSDDLHTYREGCLSVPDNFAEVDRPEKCRVKFLDYNGKPQEIEAEGLLATCIQHELDHLNGILFIDRISKLKKKMILKKLTKAHKEDQLDEPKGHAL